MPVTNVNQFEKEAVHQWSLIHLDLKDWKVLKAFEMSWRHRIVTAIIASTRGALGL